jgi:hypothetical protein
MEELDGIGKRDPRTTSLKFMYSLPDKAQSAPSTSSHRHNDVDEDDIMVKRFRDKLSGHSQEIESEHKSQSEDRPGDLLHHTNMTPEEYSKLHELKSKSSFGASAKQSLLERSVGRKHLYGLSQTELEERHPRLKNAPIEGAYARNVEIKHKPFHDVIRNVKCTRCKEWGHQSGDRECMLKDFNPHDVARQHREDPLTYINNNLVLEKQRLVLKHASGMSSENQQLLLDEGEYVRFISLSHHQVYSFIPNHWIDDESDPEADYLATLTSHEKRLLLRRLDVNVSYCMNAYV